MRNYILLSAVLLVSANAHADVTSLTLSSATVDACKDYFTSAWAEPMDMDTPTSDKVHGGDILYNLVPRETNDLSAYSYSSGVFSTSATGANPYFYILSWNDPEAIAEPRTTRFGRNNLINPASDGYNLLSFRMYTDVASDFQVYWDKENNFAISDPVTTYAGWHTYQIDLSTANINSSSGTSPSWNSGNINGIRIDPSRNNVGAAIKIDWIQLTPSSSGCSNFTVNYTSASASDLVSIFIDDDTDPTNGYQQRSVPLTGGAGSTSFNTTWLYPGSYSVYAIATPDYASSYYNPWDMDTSKTDIDSTRIFNFTPADNNGYTGGKYCGTVTASDSNFYMQLPDKSTIDAAKFTEFSMDLTLTLNGAAHVTPNYINITFFGTDGAVKGSTTINTAGDGTYTKSLSGISGWSGQIGSLRINPVEYGQGGIVFCADNIKLGAAAVGALTTPTKLDATPTQITLNPRRIVKFVQPDDEGGEDYASTERGNPWAMDSTNDFEEFYNLTSATLYPGSSYTDSGGNVKIGDYFEATSATGSDDPINFSVAYTTRINPEKYKIACFNLDVLASTSIYHSVARVLWQRNSTPVNGDDIVIRTIGDARYCLRMDNMRVDEGGTPNPHPWNKNSDGSDIDYWRIDPHEEHIATTYRFADIRLAADHKSGSQYAIVLAGNRDAAVSVYYNTTNTTSGGTLVGTLSAARNTDVLLWNTNAVTAGTYYLYATVDSNSFLAPSPVIVDSSYIDATAPVLVVDAPRDGHQFTSSLEFAGYAIDNIRLAAVEVFIDNVFQNRLTVSGFNKTYRDTYLPYPYASNSLFNQYLDTSAISTGAHTVRLDAYDTAGNKTSHTASVTKVTDDSQVTAPIVYSVPNEAPISYAIATPTPTPSPKVSAKVKKDTVTLTVTTNSCSSLVVQAGSGKDKTAALIAAKGKTIIAKSGISTAKIQAVASKVTGLRSGIKDSKIYLLATCNGTSQGNVTTLNAKKIKGRKQGAIKAVIKSLSKAKVKAKVK